MKKTIKKKVLSVRVDEELEKTIIEEANFWEKSKSDYLLLIINQRNNIPIPEAIKHLKSNGYKIYKPVQDFKEV
ncbi:MAG: hypothetical protein KBB58_12625 [Ferruginibacter sp.]|nr:hypothetical protein [Ferruginibacter sp.]